MIDCANFAARASPVVIPAKKSLLVLVALREARVVSSTALAAARMDSWNA